MTPVICTWAGLARITPGQSGLELIAAIPVKIKSFPLDNPPRYVLDLDNLVLDKKYALPFDSAEPGYSNIRVGQFSAYPFKARLVYDLTDAAFRPQSISQNGKSLLTLGISREATLEPSTEVKIGLAKDGSGVVINGLIASEATFEVIGERTLNIIFRHAQIDGATRDYTSDGKEAGITSMKVKNGAADAVHIQVTTLEPIPDPSVDYDRSKRRAILIFDRANFGTEGVEPLLPSPAPGKNKLGLAGKKIVIDPGHGGTDPGAVMDTDKLGPTVLMEKDLNLRMGLDLARRLEAGGADVVLTRDDDTFIELVDRRELATLVNADLFVSIHANSFRQIPCPPHISGVEVYYHKAADESVAELFYRHIVARTGRGGRGQFQANFVVVKHPSVPSVLVETGYMCNAEEYKLFADPSHAYEKKVVTGLLEGIEAFFSGDTGYIAPMPEVFSEMIIPPSPDLLGELVTHVALGDYAKSVLISEAPQDSIADATAEALSETAEEVVTPITYGSGVPEKAVDWAAMDVVSEKPIPTLPEQTPAEVTTSTEKTAALQKLRDPALHCCLTEASA